MTPRFTLPADAFSAYEPQTQCLTAAQPGTLGLAQLILATYPGVVAVTAIRPCNGSVSEHHDGRAIDVMLNVTNPAQRAVAEAFLGWLLATDNQGNTFANARRLGVMYLIWNKQMWRSYRASEGWLPYTGGEAHTDHIHISLSNAGGKKLTSWWLAGPPDVFTSAGVQRLNGRDWRTTCGAFGAAATRCTTYIWASQTVWSKGRYVTTVGWVLSRVTYVGSPGPEWDANPLAVPGTFTSASGRTWKTTCNAATGPRTCRSWLWTSLVSRTKTAKGYTYKRYAAWVLRSEVRLTAPAPPAPPEPAAISAPGA
jgi:hypothetical protein